jgi:hypothetical protein
VLLSRIDDPENLPWQRKRLSTISCVRLCQHLNEMGVARVVPMFPPEKADKVLPIVDRWAKIMKEVNG